MYGLLLLDYEVQKSTLVSNTPLSMIQDDNYRVCWAKSVCDFNVHDETLWLACKIGEA